MVGYLYFLCFMRLQGRRLTLFLFKIGFLVVNLYTMVFVDVRFVSWKWFYERELLGGLSSLSVFFLAPLVSIEKGVRLKKSRLMRVHWCGQKAYVFMAFS